MEGFDRSVRGIGNYKVFEYLVIWEIDGGGRKRWEINVGNIVMMFFNISK